MPPVRFLLGCAVACTAGAYSQCLGQRSGDRGELRGELSADERDCGDDHDRDQAGSAQNVTVTLTVSA
jgi:hypothetical protein